MALPAPAPGTTVVVTGASSGIGTELARELAARGHGVTLVARRRDRLEELAGQLRDRQGTDVRVEPCDLADQDARAALVAALREEGRPAVVGLCNNAGFGSNGAFHELPVEREAEQVRLNVGAAHELTGTVLPAMVERGAGAVLNVASIAASQPLPRMATYAATKAFLLAFSEALHTELSGTGVSVTALCPGPVDTGFNAAAGIAAPEGVRLAALFRVDAGAVAAQAVDGMEAGRRTVTPGTATKALSAFGRYLPRKALLPFADRLGAERLLE